jgi:hypothetical protein
VSLKGPLPAEDADYYAESMSDLERQVIALCAMRQTIGYSRLAHKTGATYAAVKRVGDRLQSMNLAAIKPTMMAGEFSGSGIFLNERGEQIRLAIAARTGL